MPIEIDNGEARVNNFINSLEKNKTDMIRMNQFNNSPETKIRKLNMTANSSKGVCLDAIFAKLYKDALPMDDIQRNDSFDDIRNDIHNFIDNRSDGRGIEYYIREAINQNKSSQLKKIMECADDMIKNFYNEKADEIATISIEDLDYHPKEDDVEKVSKKLDYKEISDVIRNNVASAIQAEAERAKKEKEYNDQLQQQLEEDDSVVDDSTMESALNKIQINMPRVYQPSLMEAIMIGKTKIAQESSGTMNDAYIEAVHEYTKLSLLKALKLESFSPTNTCRLANSYL